MNLSVSLMTGLLVLGISAASWAESPVVVLETSMGTIKIAVDEGKAPISAKNFLSYVKDGFYDGTVFHRVMDGFMVQGGGFDENFKEKATKAPIKNEAGNGLKNKRGTLAMARTNVVDSATSQFFINLVDNVDLDHKGKNPKQYGYAVFGKVIEGMDVVDKIKKVKTGPKGFHQNVPVENIVIKKAMVVK